MSETMTEELTTEMTSSANAGELKRTRFFFGLDKEQDWITEMAAAGWRLVRITYGINYDFVPCQPGEYVCQTVMVNKATGGLDKDKREEIVQLLAASGALLVEQRKPDAKIMLYAMSRTDTPSQAVYTDLDSRINEHSHRSRTFIISLLAMLGGGVIGGVVGYNTAAFLPGDGPVAIVVMVLATIAFALALPLVVSVIISFVTVGLRSSREAKRLKNERAVFENTDDLLD
jgi:hypothetical protein